MSDHSSLFDGESISNEAHLPATPYDGSSGWSGTDTSRQRADDADKGGGTKWRQAEALAFLHRRAERGATWRELADHLSIHHGPASGALSVLHKVGSICRLTESREGSKVYVLPIYVAGRDTESFGRTKRAHLCPNCGTEVA